MGSIGRVNVNYIDLEHFIAESKVLHFLLYDYLQIGLAQEGILIMGNEANGISVELEKLVQNRLTIPRFGAVQNGKS
jgi:TrmH family RNA methyltransferase